MPTTATAYGPFDAGAGANITEDFWRKMAHLWVPSGPIRGYLNGLQPFGDSTGLQFKVKTGAAHVRGHYGEWTVGDTIIGIDAVAGIPGGQSRYDRAIVRADFVNNRLELDKLTGTAAASPALPGLTQSTSIWEELLGDLGPWTNATTTVAAASVVDRRKYAVSEAPGAAPEKLDEATPSGASNVDFTGISSGYSCLELQGSLKTNQAAAQNLKVTFNGDSTGPYEWGVSSVTLNPTGANSGSNANDTSMVLAFAGVIVCAFRLLIPNYASTTIAKAISGTAHRYDGLASDVGAVCSSGAWAVTTSAINRITMTPLAGTVTGKVTLWGWP